VDAALFSFNSSGACKRCNGSGVICTDRAFPDGVKSSCEICYGKRFRDEVLAYTLGGKSIGDALGLTVAGETAARRPENSSKIISQRLLNPDAGATSVMALCFVNEAHGE
jgi:excinuclease UvrABC ATPase subunit